MHKSRNRPNFLNLTYGLFPGYIWRTVYDLLKLKFFGLENNIFCFLFEEKKSKEDYLELIIGCKSFGDMRDQLENLYH